MAADFPGNNSVSDILVLCFGKMRDKISAGEWSLQKDEMCQISQMELEHLIKEVKQEFGDGFAKGYREMPEGEFVKVIMDEMERWQFLKREEGQEVKICPAVGKLRGEYPKDYVGGSKNE